MLRYVIFFPLVFGLCLAQAHASTDIRVLLLEDQKEIMLKFQAPVLIRNPNSGKVLWRGQPGEIMITPTGELIQIAQQIYSFHTILIESDSPITVNGRSYRGSVKIWNQGGEKLALVNILDIEDYLRGTMKTEISPLWPMPALKAQAVVARSYALYRRRVVRTKTDRPYDLTSDILSQVYVGVSGEHERSNQAIRETMGEVLTDKEGNILEALYHACCGGFTEAAEEVWGGASELKSVQCPFCTDSPYYNWQAKISIPDFVKIWFGRSGIFSRVSLEPVRVSSTGRWRDIRIRYGNQSKIVRGADFRQKIGPDLIRSTRFKVRVGERQLSFSGNGWGHGAGLCQWGARGMKGVSYKEILLFYYPSSQSVH
jgi:stage II sporulation protein D